ISQQSYQAKARQICHRTEDHEDKKNTRCVDSSHQLAKRKQCAKSVLTDCESHSSSRADRRELHNHFDNSEQDMTCFIEQVENRHTSCSNFVERNPEENCEKQHLQNFALGESVHESVGNNIQQEILR